MATISSILVRRISLFFQICFYAILTLGRMRPALEPLAGGIHVMMILCGLFHPLGRILHPCGITYSHRFSLLLLSQLHLFSNTEYSNHRPKIQKQSRILQHRLKPNTDCNKNCHKSTHFLLEIHECY